MYLIGDVQGCHEALDRLLAEVGFSPSRDRAWLLGDLVNRGPDSLATLRRVRDSDGALDGLLGNHDLHLLAVAAGIRRPHRLDTLDALLDAPDRESLLAWLRERPLARRERGWLLVHAGVLPAWDGATALSLAGEVEAVLAGPDWAGFLAHMYGNEPSRWDDALRGADRLRVIVNALTRLRFCTPDGTMEFATKDGSGEAPPGHVAWFDAPGRRSAGERIAFGHWSTLGAVTRDDLLALDTGCVWGGCLTAVALDEDGAVRERVSVRCPMAQRPG